MFEKYRKILNPPSILEAVDPEILHALMMAFSFRQGTAMTLLFDSSATPPKGQSFHRLDPFPKSNEDRNKRIFNPFCRRLREDSKIDDLCRKCDEKNAEHAFLTQQTGIHCYPCHMGLYDLTYPVRVADAIRGVLFSGQRAPLWSPEGMQKIHHRICEVAPQMAADLQLLVDTAHFGEPSHAQLEFESLKSEFAQFGQLFQNVITNVYEVKRAQGKTEALVEVSKRLSQAVGNEIESWTRAIDEVLTALEELYSVPVMLLVRRESRFIAMCVSPKLQSAKDKAVPVVELISVPDLAWQEYNDGVRVHRILSAATGAPPPTQFPMCVYRVDQKTALSAMLVVRGKITSQQKSFLADCARILAAQATEGVLFERLRIERERFAREVTFTGHTLKTPLQRVLFQLRRLHKYSQGQDLPRDEAGRLFVSTRKQILNAVFDAQQLQLATRDLRTNVEILEMVTELCLHNQAKAADRGISIRFDDNMRARAHVHAVESHLRVALSNLIDNAIKYSFANKVVKVSIERVRKDAVIELSNYGVGISDAHKESLYQYGSRAALKDTKQSRVGFGLGLIQAKQFIESCGGSLHLDNRVLNETDPNDIRHLVEVRVTLPLCS